MPTEPITTTVYALYHNGKRIAQYGNDFRKAFRMAREEARMRTSKIELVTETTTIQHVQTVFP
jgi:hypothetical protein